MKINTITLRNIIKEELEFVLHEQDKPKITKKIPTPESMGFVVPKNVKNVLNLFDLTKLKKFVEEVGRSYKPVTRTLEEAEQKRKMTPEKWRAIQRKREERRKEQSQGVEGAKINPDAEKSTDTATGDDFEGFFDNEEGYSILPGEDAEFLKREPATIITENVAIMNDKNDWLGLARKSETFQKNIKDLERWVEVEYAWNFDNEKMEADREMCRRWIEIFKYASKFPLIKKQLPTVSEAVANSYDRLIECLKNAGLRTKLKVRKIAKGVKDKAQRVAKGVKDKAQIVKSQVVEKLKNLDYQQLLMNLLGPAAGAAFLALIINFQLESWAMYPALIAIMAQAFILGNVLGDRLNKMVRPNTQPEEDEDDDYSIFDGIDFNIEDEDE